MLLTHFILKQKLPLLTVILLVYFGSLPGMVYANDKQISEVFIEASGNNRYEAKIKAHELGMQRALYLVADKLGLNKEDIKSMPYGRLREVFKPLIVNNELSLIEKYNATVTYEYSIGKLYKLLLDYGNDQVDDKFYEYIIIPVFKQGDYLNIWEQDDRWNDFWIASRKLLNKHKIIIPQKNLFLSKKINEQNVFNLTYEDYLQIFKNQLFKGVLVVSAEFFTNRVTRESIIRVKIYKHDSNSSTPIISQKDYQLNELADIPQAVNNLINKIIDEYGKLPKNPRNDQVDDSSVNQAIEENQPILMNFDAYSKQELDVITAKLQRVKEIDSFRIEHDYDTRYRVLMYVNVSEYELAEGLYLNGLSYKIHGNLYHLIDVKTGS